jgi:hypothetical protein
MLDQFHDRAYWMRVFGRYRGILSSRLRFLANKGVEIKNKINEYKVILLLKGKRRAQSSIVRAKIKILITQFLERTKNVVTLSAFIFITDFFLKYISFIHFQI